MQSISVIIVNYNSGPFLNEVVDHLKNLYAGLEIIVVDNHSTDQSLSALYRDPEITVLPQDRNHGFGAAANIGARHASRPFLLFLNPDCFPAKEALPRMRLWLDADSQHGACGGLLLDFFGREQNGGRRKDPTWGLAVGKCLSAMVGKKIFPTFDLSGNPLSGKPELVDGVSGACLMVKTSIHKELGGFDESFFLHFEDLDYCRRVRQGGWTVGFIPDAAFCHYQGASGNVSRVQLAFFKGESFLRYMVKFKKRPSIISRLSETLVGSIRRLDQSGIPVPVRQFTQVEVTPGQIRLTREILTGQRSVILVLGARSDLGEAFCSRLSALGIANLAISRVPKSSAPATYTVWGSEKLIIDFARAIELKVEALVTFCPVWQLASYETYLAAQLPSDVPWIVMSSTSITTKAGSSQKESSAIAEQLRRGEEWVKASRASSGAQTLIIRPTIVYGGSKNRNVNLIRHLAKTLKVRPIFTFLTGKRNPVHSDDIAAWICQRIQSQSENVAAPGSSLATVEVQGGEEVSFAEFLDRVVSSTPGRKIELRFGKSIMKFVILVLRCTSKRHQIPKDFIERLSKDFIFNNQGSAELGFLFPRKFRP